MKKSDIVICVLGLICFLIVCSVAEEKTSIGGGIFLIAILLYAIFRIIKKHGKISVKPLTEDCSMDEQI